MADEQLGERAVVDAIDHPDGAEPEGEPDHAAGNAGFLRDPVGDEQAKGDGDNDDADRLAGWEIAAHDGSRARPRSWRRRARSSRWRGHGNEHHSQSWCLWWGRSSLAPVLAAVRAPVSGQNGGCAPDRHG